MEELTKEQEAALGHGQGVSLADVRASAAYAEKAQRAQIVSESGLAGSDPNINPHARMITQRECCAINERRESALRHAINFGGSSDAHGVVRDADIFATYLQGDDHD